MTYNFNFHNLPSYLVHKYKYHEIYLLWIVFFRFLLHVQQYNSKSVYFRVENGYVRQWNFDSW